MGYGRRSERYPADFIGLLSLRLPARREYITAAEYNALIDAIVEAMG